MPRLIKSDPALFRRYEALIDLARESLTGTSLVASAGPIDQGDLVQVAEFLRKADPTRAPEFRMSAPPSHPPPEAILDPSVMGDWNDPGGPAEHFRLAIQAAEFFTKSIQNNLRDPSEIEDGRTRELISEIRALDIGIVLAAAAFHDSGRLLTHVFGSAQAIQRALVDRIGLRSDIKKALPAESVMLTPSEVNMSERIFSLSAAQVLVRLSDEFGKRRGSTRRTLLPQECTRKNWEAWAARYLERPATGRPSETNFRNQIERHLDNEERYFQALAKWVADVSTTNLMELVCKFNEIIQPDLAPAIRGLRFTSDDLVDGQVSRESLAVGNVVIGAELLQRRSPTRVGACEDSVLLLQNDRGTQICAVVVDGATEIVRNPGLPPNISGGAFIAQSVQSWRSDFADINPTQVLPAMNRHVGERMRASGIIDTEAISLPYGSVAAVMIDLDRQLISVANAGDVFVIAIDQDEQAHILTVDDVHDHDARTFDVARRIASEIGNTPRYVMETALGSQDPRSIGVIEQMKRSTMLGFAGQIRRLNGQPNFNLTAASTLPLNGIKEILIFTDGGIPCDLDSQDPTALKVIAQIASNGGLIELDRRIRQAASDDPDWHNVRFRDVDDLAVIRLIINP